jgi:hypothetical protein
MDNQAKVKKIARLGAEEARVLHRIRKDTERLAEIHADRCVLLCTSYAENAAALGLDPGIDPTVIEPKEQ